jgi:hypothetical protein
MGLAQPYTVVFPRAEDLENTSESSTHRGHGLLTLQTVGGGGGGWWRGKHHWFHSWNSSTVAYTSAPAVRLAWES